MQIIKGSDFINLFKSLAKLELWSKYLKAKADGDEQKAKVLKELLDEDNLISPTSLEN